MNSRYINEEDKKNGGEMEVIKKVDTDRKFNYHSLYTREDKSLNE